MAISIPGLSLSILRQQTTVQAGLPLLISGRFTAFGLGVPTYIRVFLEGPSYDPQLRSFDTFASPFSGDYSTNVIAEKDGQYSVYAQAFPPPLIPTGPPFPEAMMLLPPIAESTRPPLVVGYPFDGGVNALLPDGTTQRLTAPPMQPIEFRPMITVAPGISVTAPGVPAAYPGIPAYPPVVPPAPPPAVPPVEVITRAAIDDIRFSPEEINPGMEATGVMSWRNTGDAPHLFDTVFYLVSPVGVRYGPLQVNQSLSANPQVPATQNLRFGTAGMPSGIYSVVAEIYDSTTGVLLTAITLPSRLSIREIAPPVVPPPPPPPVVPEVPTIDILGTPSLNLPRQLNVGDVWTGSVSLPTFGTIPYFAEARLLLQDPSMLEYIVAQGGQTLQPYETLQIPVNYDTSGFTGGNYTILMRVFDQFGQSVAEFPMGFLTMIEAIAPPEIPVPEIPEIPTAPTLPTADMFATPFINLPTEVEIGELWSGNISIPTQVPSALQALPSLPSYPVNAGLQLQSPIGQLFDVGTYRPTFTLGQPINLPVNFDSSVLPQEGIHNLILNISDLQGNPLFSNVIGSLRALMPALPPIPEVPEIPTPPLLSKFIDITVQMGAQRVEVGQSITIPFTYTHVGAPEVVTLRAAIGDDRPVYLGGFDEVWHVEKTVSVPAHAVPTPIQDSITIQIRPKFLAAGIYSVYAKVESGLPVLVKAISPVLPNIIEVFEVPEVLSRFIDITVQMGVQRVEVGQSITIPFTYTHVGAPEVVTLRAAIGDDRPVYLGGFDEVWYADKTVSVPAHAVPTSIQDSITIQIRPKFQAAGIYSVYAKVNGGIPKAISPVLLNIIEVIEVPVLPRADIKGFDFRILTAGPFNPGGSISWIGTGQYKGRAQGGSLTIVLGLGSFAPIITIFTLPPIPVNFAESTDWAPFTFRGDLTIPDGVTPRLTYSTRARLETFTDPTHETDRDFNVINIAAAPPAPPPPPPEVPVPPPPPEVPAEEYTLDIRVSPMAAGHVWKDPDKATYSYGEVVTLTARPVPQIGVPVEYRFDHWTADGEWAGTSNPLRYMVVGDYVITAHFREV